MSATTLDHQAAFAQIVEALVAWGLPRDDVAFALDDAVEALVLPPREQLFAQDTPLTHVYLLREGRIYLERVTEQGGQRRIVLRHEIRPGAFLGHYDLLYHQRYTTRARALEESRLIAIDAPVLNRLLYRFPRLRQRIAPMDRIGRLRTIPPFATLDPTTLSYLAESARTAAFPTGAQIYDDGTPAQEVYFIDQGQVRLSWPGGEQEWLGNGMAFGYLDQILKLPPAAGEQTHGHRAETTAPTALFAVPRAALIDIADFHPDQLGHELHDARMQTLHQIALFDRYSAEEQRRLLGYMSHYHVPTHHLIMQQGELGDSLWVLMPDSRGQLHALEGGRALQPTPVYGPNFFSELALRVEHPLDSTVQAEPGSQWLRLHIADFQAFVQAHGEEALEKLTLSPAAERLLGQSEARQHYRWLQKGERLIVFQRRHWLMLARKIWFAILLFALLLVSLIVWGSVIWSLAWLRLIFGVAGTIALMQLLWGVTDYLNDYLLVTNQRLVRQEKVIFFAEWRQAALLEQIRNVDIARNFWGNVFHYGDLRVHTAAAGAIDFDYVPDPEAVRRAILEQQSHRQLHYQASSKMVIQNILQERLGLRLRLPPRVTPEEESILPPTVLRAASRLPVWSRRLLDPLWAYINIGRHLQQFEDDKIIWRKHWFVLLTQLFAPLLILIIVLVLALGQHLLPFSPAIANAIAPLDVLWVFIGLIMLAWMAWIVADWRNDTYEVDSQEVADVEKKPLFFSENRRTAPLAEIENIEISIPSPIHFLLNFGNVRLRTAATHGEFTFDWVPNPHGVSEEIRRRIELYRHQQEADRARQRAQELPDWFEMYNRLENDAGPSRIVP
jgi:CRP-like cAMP-binding protein